MRTIRWQQRAASPKTSKAREDSTRASYHSQQTVSKVRPAPPPWPTTESPQLPFCKTAQSPEWLACYLSARINWCSPWVNLSGFRLSRHWPPLGTYSRAVICRLSCPPPWGLTCCWLTLFCRNCSHTSPLWLGSHPASWSFVEIRIWICRNVHASCLYLRPCVRWKSACLWMWSRL